MEDNKNKQFYGNKIHPEQRNRQFLVHFTEQFYRCHLKTQDYTMDEINKAVEDYRIRNNHELDFDDYFHAFSIEFADWCVNQKWDKTSASLGVGDNGENIAKPTKQLMEDFKEYLTKKVYN